MKTIVLVSLMLIFAKPVQDDQGILGVWFMSENNTELEIVKDGEFYKGTVIASDQEEAI